MSPAVENALTTKIYVGPASWAHMTNGGTADVPFVVDLWPAREWALCVAYGEDWLVLDRAVFEPRPAEVPWWLWPLVGTLAWTVGLLVPHGLVVSVILLAAEVVAGVMWFRRIHRWLSERTDW